jgi:hypothetical protein
MATDGLTEDLLESAVPSPFKNVEPKFAPFPTPGQPTAGPPSVGSNPARVSPPASYPSPALSPSVVSPEVTVKTVDPKVPSTPAAVQSTADMQTKDEEGLPSDEKRKEDVEREKMEQQLEEISARTMYNMVSEVIDAKGGKPKKLIFFTNHSHSFSPRTHGFCSTTIPAVINNNKHKHIILQSSGAEVEPETMSVHCDQGQTSNDEW